MKKHKTESRDRTIKQTYCAQPECQFFGKPARQGVCHTVPEHEDWIKKFRRKSAELAAERREMKRRYRGKEYVRYIEAYCDCAMLNWSLGIDELILLRRDCALLEERVARLSKGKRA